MYIFGRHNDSYSPFDWLPWIFPNQRNDFLSLYSRRDVNHLTLVTVVPNRIIRSNKSIWVSDKSTTSCSVASVWQLCWLRRCGILLESFGIIYFDARHHQSFKFVWRWFCAYLSNINFSDFDCVCVCVCVHEFTIN